MEGPHLEDQGNQNLDLEEVVYEADLNLLAEFQEEDGENTQIEPETLGVVRCTFTQSIPNDDWRRTTIFHTFFRTKGWVCKLIIDSGSCVNAISTNSVQKLGLVPADHSYPCRVSWVDSTSIPVRTRCLVPISFPLILLTSGVMSFLWR